MGGGGKDVLLSHLYTMRKKKEKKIKGSSGCMLNQLLCFSFSMDVGHCPISKVYTVL